MKVIKVEGMHCEKCVERIEKAFRAEGIDGSVSLKEQTVTVNGDDKMAEAAIEELDDLGFEVLE